MLLLYSIFIASRTVIGLAMKMAIKSAVKPWKILDTGTNGHMILLICVGFQGELQPSGDSSSVCKEMGNKLEQFFEVKKVVHGSGDCIVGSIPDGSANTG